MWRMFEEQGQTGLLLFLLGLSHFEVWGASLFSPQLLTPLGKSCKCEGPSVQQMWGAWQNIALALGLPRLFVGRNVRRWEIWPFSGSSDFCSGPDLQAKPWIFPETWELFCVCLNIMVSQL